MKVERRRSRRALTIVAVAATALILAFALGGGTRWLAEPPAGAAGEPQCGTAGSNLVEWEAAVVDLNPDSGQSGTVFEVNLSNVAPNSVQDQPAEVLWDWNPFVLDGELIGSGTIPQGETSISMDAAVPSWTEYGGYVVTACWYREASDTWFYKGAAFEVFEPTPTPPPTPTPTPTPTPKPTKEVTIPARSWLNFPWTGDTDSPEEVAHCFNDSAIAAMWRLDAETQEFERWLPGRDDLTTMGHVARLDVLWALNASDEPHTCTMAEPAALPHRMLTIPARSWGNFAWTGDTASPEDVAHCWNDSAIAAMWRLDTETQEFERWLPGRDDLTTMGDVARLDVLWALNASDQPATCTTDGG
jgi:hypothetical protein